MLAVFTYTLFQISYWPSQHLPSSSSTTSDFDILSHFLLQHLSLSWGQRSDFLHLSWEIVRFSCASRCSVAGQTPHITTSTGLVLINPEKWIGCQSHQPHQNCVCVCMLLPCFSVSSAGALPWPHSHSDSFWLYWKNSFSATALLIFPNLSPSNHSYLCFWEEVGDTIANMSSKVIYFAEVDDVRAKYPLWS